jgi:outer membrane lipoprotein carrier protein
MITRYRGSIGTTVALLAAVVGRPVAAQTAESSYDRMAAAWAATTTLEAAFEQVITNPLLGRTATSRGLFQQQRPDKVAITFTDPTGDRIVGDGKTLWVYLPSSAPGQVLKLPGNAEGAVVADLLGQLLDTPRKAFTITGGEVVPINGRPTRRVQLVPRAAGRAPFQKAVLWLDETGPRPVKLQVQDPQGIERTITLTTWILDAPLPKGAFAFKVPKGAKISTRVPGS